MLEAIPTVIHEQLKLTQMTSQLFLNVTALRPRDGKMSKRIK